MSKLRDLHSRWMAEPAYKQDYEALAEEFRLADAIIGARAAAGLTQSELAERLETTQSTIARLESGRTMPSTRTLKRVAEATGTRLRISFEAV